MENTCIYILVKRIGDALSFACVRLSDALQLSINRRSKHIAIETTRSGEAITIITERIGEELSFRCGLVCSVSSAFYLDIPQESIWLLPENGFSQDVVVYANVKWTIE